MKTGREEAQGMVAQLYPLYFEELTRFLTGLLKSRAAAEDVAEETFLRAL